MNPSKPATDSPARTIESRPGRTVVDPAVAEESKKQREQRLIGLFNKFDVKRTGLLEFTHIHAMVKAIMIPTSSTKKKESSNIANVILQSLDKVRFVSIVSFFGLSSLVVVVVVVCCCCLLLFAFLFFPHTSLVQRTQPTTNRTRVVVLTRKSLLHGSRKVLYFNQNNEECLLKEGQYKRQF